MELLIEPGRAEKNYWRDLWRYRELFYFLAWRDILVRYKQTVIGIAWAVIRPFLTMIVFTIVFGKIAKLHAPGDIPYALMVMAAMLPWQFFSTSMSEASNSLITNANLISKIYFPRLIVPGRLSHHRVRGFSHYLGADGNDDALVSIFARLETVSASCFHDFSLWRGFRHRPVAVRAQRGIPRLPLHRTLYRAIRALHLARWLQQHHRAGKVAAVVFAQPDGGRDRRLPLVPVARRIAA